MNEDFMLSAWRKPPPPFAAQLRGRLRQLDAPRTASPIEAVACNDTGNWMPGR